MACVCIHQLHSIELAVGLHMAIIMCIALLVHCTGSGLRLGTYLYMHKSNHDPWIEVPTT